MKWHEPYLIIFLQRRIDFTQYAEAAWEILVEVHSHFPMKLFLLIQSRSEGTPEIPIVFSPLRRKALCGVPFRDRQGPSALDGLETGLCPWF
jgi:hypothetical protein